MPNVQLEKKTFAKTYFLTCFVGYFIGLVSTIVVMHTFQHAQPALLYLVPACLATSFGLAVVRGEVAALLEYSEEKKEEEKEKKKEKKNRRKKKRRKGKKKKGRSRKKEIKRG